MAKILILEDDVKAAQLVEKHLRAGGHACVVEGNGAKGLAAVETGDFNLVIIDVMLPSVSGFEVCRCVRRNPRLFMMPVLILSAMADDEEVRHGLAQGADDYVTKPFEMANLVSRVEALLRANSAGQDIDTLTSLPSATATKRILQQKISKDESFTLAYGELVHLREFNRQFGPEARTKAIRHLARGLKQSGGHFDDSEFVVGHMGGGHFVCALPKDKAEAFCIVTRKVWGAHLKGFYASIGHEQSYNAAQANTVAGKRIPILDIMFCLTHRETKDSTTPQQIFEVLSRIRAKAHLADEGGIFWDQRGQNSQGSAG